MTVKELIEKLSKCDPEKRVTIDYRYCTNSYWPSEEEEEEYAEQVYTFDFSDEVHISTYEQDINYAVVL